MTPQSQAPRGHQSKPTVGALSLSSPDLKSHRGPATSENKALRR